MQDPFEFEAKIYDDIWREHDYAADVVFMKQLFADHDVKRVLDVACGTGSHLVELSKAGFDARGLDISKAMVELAKRKTEGMGIGLKVGDMRGLTSLYAPASFDAVICMGASIAHLVTDDELRETLRGFTHILRDGGLLIFTANNSKKIAEERLGILWMGQHVKTSELEILELDHAVRESTKPDILVWTPLWLLKQRGKVDFEVREHRVRWFTNEEMVHLLSTGGFDVLSCYGDTVGKELFLADKHDLMMFVCKKRAEKAEKAGAPSEESQPSEP